jgi:hypothetical protein
VTGNDLSGIVDKDGRHKAEGFDAIRDLADLCAGMLARIPLAGREPLHRKHFDMLLNAVNALGRDAARPRYVISALRLRFI